MLINNLQQDLKQLLANEKMTQQKIADKVGIAQSAIMRTAKNPINKGYLHLLEGLGYDIKITYVKRTKDINEVL